MKYKKMLVLSLMILFTMSVETFAKENVDKKVVTEKVLKAKLYGTITEFSLKLPSTWVIKNKKILVDNKTIIKEKNGKIAKGAYVEVKGYYLGKDFIAKKIEVRSNNDDDDDDNKDKSDKNSKNSK